MSNIHYIIATHGQLAEGFADTVDLLTHHHDCYAVTAYREDEFPANLIHIFETLPLHDPIVIFTDLACGSVTQKILELYGQRPTLHILAGVNLSLILEVILSNQTPDEGYLKGVVEAAKEQICYLGNICEKQ